LIELCLQEQAKGLPNRPFSQQMLDYLGRCYLNNLLSDQQQRRLFEQAATVELRVRPRVVLGDSVPCEIVTRGCGPGPAVPGLWIKINFGPLHVDGRQVLKGPVSLMWGQGWRAGSRFNTAFPCDVLGRHTLKVAPTVKLFRGPYRQEASSVLCFERSIPLEADFEVVQARADSPIKLIRDPSLKDTLRAAIRPKDFTYKRSAGPEFSGIIRCAEPPINVAFDVFGRIGGSEFKIASIYKAKRQTGDWQVEGLHPGPRVRSMDILLRSSEAVARKTVDLFEIWDGELIFEDVPVDQPSGPVR